jgi:histidine triad (HIT) family protein
MEASALGPRSMSAEAGGAPAAPCVFCDIVARRAPGWIVYEDNRSLAFLDLFPFTRGHLLVIPKRHVDRLIDLPAEDHAPFLASLLEVCRRVERLSHHYNVALNQGELAGQIIFHLHFHIIPRYGEGNPFQSGGRRRIEEPEAGALLGLLTAP